MKRCAGHHTPAGAFSDDQCILHALGCLTLPKGQPQRSEASQERLHGASTWPIRLLKYQGQALLSIIQCELRQSFGVCSAMNLAEHSEISRNFCLLRSAMSSVSASSRHASPCWAGPACLLQTRPSLQPWLAVLGSPMAAQLLSLRQACSLCP